MIRNYNNPEGTISLIDSTSVTVPVKVFTSSNTGGPIAGAVVGRTNAVVTMIFCNTEAASLTDETTNQVVVSVYVVKNGSSYSSGNRIISDLIIPAGETVFFAEEKIVLDAGDEIWVGTSSASILSVTISSLEV